MFYKDKSKLWAIIFQNIWDKLRRATVKKLADQNATGATSVRWLPVDEVVKNILGPESAYLRGHQQTDNPPQFASNLENVPDDSNESSSAFIQDNVLSVAGMVSARINLHSVTKSYSWIWC